MQSVVRKNPLIQVVVLFLIAISGYLYHFIPNESVEEFPIWAGIYTVQFVFYGVLVWLLGRSQGEFRASPHKEKRATQNLSFLKWALPIAIFARIVLLHTEPVLEDDYFRYLWDGRVTASGMNPYVEPPNSPALDHLDTDYRSDVGYPEVRTIYPPVAQAVFALSHVLFGDSLLALNSILVAFEFATGLIILRILLHLGRPATWSLLYFFNPLVLKEISNSAHVDSVAVFFATASVYFMLHRRPFVPYVLLALAFLTKFYALALFPFFLKRSLPDFKKAGKQLIAFTLVVFTGYLPFISAGTGVLGGFGTFSSHWYFNASVFEILRRLTDPLLSGSTDPIIQGWRDTEFIPRMIVFWVFATLVVVRFLKFRVIEKKKTRKPLKPYIYQPKTTILEDGLWVIGWLLVLSPVVDAWYLLWIVPFAVIERSYPWILFTFLVVCGYSWFYSPDWAPYFRLFEYGILFSYLLVYYQPNVPKRLFSKSGTTNI